MTSSLVVCHVTFNKRHPFPYAFSFIFPEMEVAGLGLLERAERRQAGPLVQLTKQASTMLVAAENQRNMRIKERSG